MLPIETGGLEKAAAVEISADADFDALDHILQNEACFGLRAQVCGNVATVARRADEAGAAIDLERVAARPLGYVSKGVGNRSEGFARRDLKPELGKHRLRIAAIILQPIAERASTDDMEAVASEVILDRAKSFGDRFEQDNAVISGLSHPVELGPPIVDSRHHSSEGSTGQRLADGDADVVTFGLKRQVHCAEIARLGHSKHAHEGSAIRVLKSVDRLRRLGRLVVASCATSEPFDGRVKSVIEIDGRSPVEQRLGAANVGITAARIVFRQRQPSDVRRTSGHRQDAVDERADRHLVWIAEIDWKTDRHFAVHQPPQAFDRIVDKAETAGLRAIAVNGDRVAS